MQIPDVLCIIVFSYSHLSSMPVRLFLSIFQAKVGDCHLIFNQLVCSVEINKIIFKMVHVHKLSSLVSFSAICLQSITTQQGLWNSIYSETKAIFMFFKVQEYFLFTCQQHQIIKISSRYISLNQCKLVWIPKFYWMLHFWKQSILVCSVWAISVIWISQFLKQNIIAISLNKNMDDVI